MPRGPLFDRQKFHELLWERSDRLHRIMFVQGEMAEELGCRFETLSIHMSKMVVEGRIKKMRAGKNNVGLYLIRDPEGFLQTGDDQDDQQNNDNSA